MSLKEILKKQGYTDEQIKMVMDEMATNKLYVSSVENPEETIKQLQQEKAGLEKAAKERKEKKSPEEAVDASAVEEIRNLKEAVRQGKINTQLIVALTKARALDVDYLMYQAEKTGQIKDIKIDDSGKIIGVDELVASLKKSHAGQFEASKEGDEMLSRVGVKKLETGDAASEDDAPITLEEAIARKYSGDEE